MPLVHGAMVVSMCLVFTVATATFLLHSYRTADWELYVLKYSKHKEDVL